MEFENQYLTYVEYVELGGKLAKMPFNLLEYRAEKQVDELTSNRFRKLSKYPQELKLCIYELMTEIKKYNETGNKTSETVGSYSVNYDKLVTSEKKQVFKNIIKAYLSNIKVNNTYVLYCGADEYGN